MATNIITKQVKTQGRNMTLFVRPRLNSLTMDQMQWLGFHGGQTSEAVLLF